MFSDQASNLILNQALNDTASSRFQRLFGASNIKIDPQGLTTETNPTARGPQVTIEQEFANNLSLTYSTNVSQSSQQIIQGRILFQSQRFGRRYPGPEWRRQLRSAHPPAQKVIQSCSHA